MFQNYPIELSFTPKFTSFYSKQSRIMAIEGMTGLKNINGAFENPENNTEVELLVSYLSRMYDFSLCYNIYDFILNTIKFSPLALDVINANYDE